VLSQNILGKPPEEILRTRVLLTIQSGRIVYRNQDLLNAPRQP